MTTIDKKKKLDQVRIIKKLIIAIDEQIKELRLKSQSLKINDYEREDVVSSIQNKNTIIDLVDKIIDLENNRAREIDKLLEKELEISKIIDGVDDLECRLLLQLRYINCRSWQAIEHIFDRSTATVKKIHNQAIRDINI